jgi:hypothetical protein
MPHASGPGGLKGGILSLGATVSARVSAATGHRLTLPPQAGVGLLGAAIAFVLFQAFAPATGKPVSATHVCVLAGPRKVSHLPFPGDTGCNVGIPVAAPGASSASSAIANAYFAGYEDGESVWL